MIVRLLTVISLPVLLSSASFAAEPVGAYLEAISGKVLVNQGKGFSVGQGNVTLKSGTKVMVGENSGAVLVYPATESNAGCQIELKPTSVTRVTGAEMCDTQLGETQGLAGDVVITPTAAESGIPPVLVGVGFFAIAAGAFAYSLSENDDDPISP